MHHGYRKQYNINDLIFIPKPKQMNTESSEKRLGNPLIIALLFILLLSLAFASVTFSE